MALSMVSGRATQSVTICYIDMFLGPQPHALAIHSKRLIPFFLRLLSCLMTEQVLSASRSRERETFKKSQLGGWFGFSGHIASQCRGARRNAEPAVAARKRGSSTLRGSSRASQLPPPAAV